MSSEPSRLMEIPSFVAMVCSFLNTLSSISIEKSGVERGLSTAATGFCWLVVVVTLIKRATLRGWVGVSGCVSLGLKTITQGKLHSAHLMG